MKINYIHTYLNAVKCGFLAIFCLLAFAVSGQDKLVIQFTGMVFSQTNGAQNPLPYVGVGILRTRRGTFTDENGFFSLAAETGDTILFNFLGYKSLQKIIPAKLLTDRFFEKIYLEQDTFQLESAIVYSIPSKEHFRPEFLEMEVTDKLKEQAEKNLSQDVLEKIAPFIPSDGRAGVSLYFAQESQKLYYAGQFKPQRIFDAMAWVEFLKALKRGDFKKKKKKE